MIETLFAEAADKLPDPLAPTEMLFGKARARARRQVIVLGTATAGIVAVGAGVAVASGRGSSDVNIVTSASASPSAPDFPGIQIGNYKLTAMLDHFRQSGTNLAEPTQSGTMVIATFVGPSAGQEIVVSVRRDLVADASLSYSGRTPDTEVQGAPAYFGTLGYNDFEGKSLSWKGQDGAWLTVAIQNPDKSRVTSDLLVLAHDLVPNFTPQSSELGTVVLPEAVQDNSPTAALIGIYTYPSTRRVLTLSHEGGNDCLASYDDGDPASHVEKWCEPTPETSQSLAVNYSSDLVYGAVPAGTTEVRVTIPGRVPMTVLAYQSGVDNGGQAYFLALTTGGSDATIEALNHIGAVIARTTFGTALFSQ